jgi:zinc transport system permease protein
MVMAVLRTTATPVTGIIKTEFHRNRGAWRMIVSGSIVMLNDFFVRAVLAGLGIAAVTGPLGCFVVWRGLAYFGDTLSHGALLGVALSLLLHVNVTLTVFLVAVILAMLLLALQRRSSLSSDALLGMLSHGSLALGLIAIAFMTWVRLDLMGLLFGDLLAVSKADIAVIYGGGFLVLAALVWAWKPLFAVTVNRDLAAAEGYNVAAYDVLLMILLAAVVAVSIKIVGVMLITSLLIIPAGAARRLSNGPIVMAVIATLVGWLSVVGGLFASLHFNTPSGPSIVVVALVLFVIGLILPLRRFSREYAHD